MTAPANYKQVIAVFKSQPQKVQSYFEHLPALIKDFTYDVAIAYAHSQVELCHNVLLYCGLAKLHRANIDVADKVIQATHLTRENFQTLFKHVFGKPIPAATRKLLEAAEKIRDKIIHGKDVGEAEKRRALVDVLDYASALNVFVKTEAGFEPFSDLRGFKGAGKSIDKATTRWLMKGMGFSAS